MFEKDQCDNISPTYQKIADLFCPVHISGLLIVCAKAQKKTRRKSNNQVYL
jgi:hypothetical protein